MTKLVIHRDHTFEFDGETYRCQRLGDYTSGDDAWEVYRECDGRTIADGVFERLKDIREWVDRCAENGWSLMPVDS